MRLKYLGKFEIIHEEFLTLLQHEEDETNQYNLDDFMRIEEDLFHGAMGESNTSAIMIQLSPCGESAKLWRAW